MENQKHLDLGENVRRKLRITMKTKLNVGFMLQISSFPTALSPLLIPLEIWEEKSQNFEFWGKQNKLIVRYKLRKGKI